MANPLKLDIVTSSDKKGLDEAARGFEKLADQVDETGDQMRETAVEAGYLNAELEKSRTRLDGLVKEFDATGDTKLLKMIRGERGKGTLLASLIGDDSDNKQQLGKFDATLEAALKSAIGHLPTINPKADLSEADEKVAFLRSELERLSKQRIGVDLDEKRALEKLVGLKAALAELGGAKGSRLRFDTDSAAKDLASLGKIFEEVGVEGAKVLAKSIEEGGDEAFRTMAASLQGALSSPVIGPIVTVALVAGVVAAAPVILATTAGALLAGVAAAGIGVGIAGQIHDPRVMKAISDTKDSLATGLTDATAAFAPVLIDVAHKAQSAFAGLEPGLKSTFDHLAPVADKLLSNLVVMGQKAAPGFEKAMNAGGHVLDRIGDDLPGLGASFSKMFDEISGGANGGADAVHDLIRLIGMLAVGIGGVLEVGGKAFSVVEDVFDTLTGNFGDLDRKLASSAGGTDELDKELAELGDHAAKAGDDMETLSNKISSTAVTSDTLAGQMSDKLFGALMGMDQATLGFAESQTKLSQSLDENGRHLDIHTEKGQANREAILAAIQANIQLYDQNIQSGMSATDAAAAFDTNTAALERQLTKAGMTKDEIDGLIGKYKKVPPGVDTDIALHGLTDAINDLDDMLARVNHLSGTHYINMVTEYENAKHSGPAPNEAQGHADGGRVKGGVPIIVGERRPELFVPDSDGEILPRVPSGYNTPVGSTPTQGGNSNAGGYADRGNRTVTFAGNVDSAFATAFMRMQREGLITIS
jgi:ribosome-associated translation inhibitor RaiA